MIILHVILAVFSLILSSYNTTNPSLTKLKVSYGIAVGTLISGVLLIVLNNASILRTCATGIVFFAAVTAMNELARRKLNTVKTF